MGLRVLKIYPSAVSKRLVDNPNNYDGQVSMPFLIKMCFTKKQQNNMLKRDTACPMSRAIKFREYYHLIYD